MAGCPYCHHAVRWWEPLTTWRGQLLYCPHCLRALRIDRGRYAVLTGVSVALISSVNLLPSDHPYVLLAIAVVVALAACVLFGKVVKADEDDAGSA
jgi:glutaredoxin